MSFTLQSLGAQAAGALGLPPLFTDWKSRLRPASFRGVPFFVLGHEETSGRRGIAHEFPLRDGGITEDLGRPLGRYTVEAYVVGADYDQQRDALRRAAYATKGPGPLVHPWLGTLQVQVLPGCSLRETRDQGGMAVFRLNLVEAETPSYAQADTAAGVLNGIGPVVSALKLAFSAGVLIATHPGFLLQALTSGLTGLVNGMLGLPVGTLPGVVGAIRAIAANPSDLCAALAALDAIVEIAGPSGARELPLDAFHRLQESKIKREQLRTSSPAYDRLPMRSPDMPVEPKFGRLWSL